MTVFKPDSREAVGMRLAELRKELGMNKAQFADTILVSKQAYGAFENGTRDLTLQAAKKIRRMFGVSLDHLFEGEKRSPLPDEQAIDPLLGAYIARKPKSVQRKILVALKALDI